MLRGRSGAGVDFAKLVLEGFEDPTDFEVERTRAGDTLSTKGKEVVA